MIDPLDHAAGLSAFIDAVETGSFSAAARRAGTTPSSVSKSIGRLERRLGVRLFVRSTRSVATTVEGAAYFERVAPLLRALAEAQDVVRTRSAEGRLRVSLPTDLGRLLLDPLTRIFIPRNPGVRLEVDLSDRHVDLVREGYDLALRAGVAPDPDLVARPLGAAPLVLVASPEHLDRHGRPETLADLAAARHVRYRLHGELFPIRFANGVTLRPEGVLDCDSGFALRSAAINGVGVAQLLRWTVDEDLRAGRLEVVMANSSLPIVPLRILHAFGRFQPLRARLFSDFVAEQVDRLAH
ncbi:LysR family transcriptional regulator [Caulobacter sp. 602-1]|uniref:LysR family transcriptional regulator n=1 Tax=Caulobacter sp. 602-1 TaxID=2492472 RepID=UPI000F6355CD|nr:LysR family transcriptional regulator [Caulobacter sp. 602-1]RRN63961.1 LysR family transcriptional regulator [Caulobacter sp. 602-1]